MVDDLFRETEHKMERSLATLRKDLSRIRTGRASLALLEGITVDAYGTPTPLHQLATLALLRDLATGRQLAVCAVLHDLNLASTFASRIVAIADGRIVREGTPLEVFHPDLVKAVFGEGLEVVARDGHPAVLPKLAGEIEAC